MRRERHPGLGWGGLDAVTPPHFFSVELAGRVEHDPARASCARQRLDLHEIGRLEPVCASQMEQGESRRRLPDREGAAGPNRPAVREDVVAAPVDVLAMIVPGEDEHRRNAPLRGDVVEQRMSEPVLVDEDDLRSPSAVRRTTRSAPPARVTFAPVLSLSRCPATPPSRWSGSSNPATAIPSMSTTPLERPRTITPSRASARMSAPES